MCESRDPGVTFRKLLEDVRSTLSGAMLLRSVQIPTLYILRSDETNFRLSHPLAAQVDRDDDRSSALSSTGFYSMYRVTDARAKLYTEPGVSNI